jgi:hypothetical protein
MASMAISSATPSIGTQATAARGSATVQTESTAKSTDRNSPDTVKISQAAQAKLMHRQGLSIAVIASSLGTNVASVDGYLNIKAATQAAATPTAAPTEHAEPAAHTASEAQSAPTAQQPLAAITAPAAETEAITTAAKE